MDGKWRSQLVERLRTSAHDSGCWGYSKDGEGRTEPTALAALALSTSISTRPFVPIALRWLADLQQPDGSVPVSRDLTFVKWTTALAILAWIHCDHNAVFTKAVERAISWLLETEGEMQKQSSVFAHDTTLIGWPWNPGTHSWIEPTAYAILALRAAQQPDNPRVREGVDLILDRTLPTGGWNYGNREVFGNVLRPMPATTGVALAALRGEPRDERIERSLRYLDDELGRVRAPLSLAWGIIGSRAWDSPPAQAENWLEECHHKIINRAPNPHYDAMILLASASDCPLLPTPAEQADG